ncbi:MAG: DUF4097 family beta strand repeat-containing protein [Acidobacteriota bacterium]
MTRATWKGTVSGDESVRVVNAFGDMRVRFGGYEGEVEVIANLQNFADEGAALVVEGKMTEQGAVIEVGFRASTGEWVNRRRPGTRMRADLVVFVPKAAPLDAAVDDGLLEIRKLKGAVRGRSESGEIVVRGIEGDLDLTTDSGRIVANLIPREADGEQRIASRSGEVSVYANPDVSLRVQVATAGQISTDVSMTIEAAEDGSRRKRGEAVVGKGTTLLKLDSDTGDIRLFQRPLARKARLRPRPAN